MERELWKIISLAITSLDRRLDKGACTHSVGRIVRVFMWAVLNDRPVLWACDRRNWRGVKPPAALPDQSTMSRRLRRADTQRFIEQLIDALDQRLAEQEAPTHGATLFRCVDGKPLTVSRHSLDQDATFGRGAGGMARGYKFHAVYQGKNAPLAWSVTSLHRNEPREAMALIDRRVTPGYLLGDANYDTNPLYQHAGERDVVLLTPRRFPAAKGLGHRPHSEHRVDAIQRLQDPSPFVRELLKRRPAVETRFANLTNFGGGLTCLPPWVRTLPRVRQWVAGKIAVRLARDCVLTQRRA